MDRFCSAVAVSLFVCTLLERTPAAAHDARTFAEAQAAGSTTGAITGTVTDSSGAVLAEVAIAVSGVALIAPRTVTSGSDGLYRIPALPPGEFSLEFTREGFKKARRDRIYVGLGFTATIDVQLGLERVHQDLTIVGGSTIIDTQSAAVSANFNARLLSDLPTSRSVFAILSATPAVHVARVEIGGTSGDASAPYAAYGILGANKPMVEGISVAGMFPLGVTLNFGSFEEVSVGTAAHGPEWPLAGVQMQVIAKSGANHYHGSVYADYETSALQSFNIDDDQLRRGAPGRPGLSPRDANRLSSYHDINADVGGYLKPDKAWWYFSTREQRVAAGVVNFPVAPLRTQLVNFTTKTTWQLTPNNKVVAFGHTGSNHQPNRLDPFGPTGGGLTAATAINTSEESTTEQRGRGWIWKGEWNSVISNRAIFEIRLGEFGADRPEEGNGTAPRFEDVGTLMVKGGNRSWQQNQRRDQLVGSLTYFKDGWFGTHSFKAGGEIFRTTAAEIWRESYPGDVLHVLRNAVPIEVYLFQTPSRSESGLWTYGAYANDSWQVNRRLTLNVGLRFDRYRVFLPEQTHPVGRFNSTPQTFAAVAHVIDWNVTLPRISVIHDLTGSGKSLVKFSYGHYSSFPPGTDLGFNANPNATTWWRRYTWSDVDGSGIWEPGEEDRLLDNRGGTALESIDPRLKLPRVKEIGAWIERQLPGSIALRTGIVWRGEQQHFLRQNASRPFDAFSLPVTMRDPGPDGRVATDDDRPALQGFQLGSGLRDQSSSIVRNVPDADSQYWTWDVTASKRLSRHWSLMFGFDHLWSHDQANAYLGQSVRQNAYPLTPNDLLNAGPDGRYEFRTWSAKIYGTYEGPWDLRLTPYLRHLSGQPFGRTFTTTLNYGNVRVLAEPIGTRRMDDMTIVDLRIEKGVWLPGSRRVAAFVDVFNLLNANPEQNVSWSSGTFLRPLSIVPPRIARVGVKMEW